MPGRLFHNDHNDRHNDQRSDRRITAWFLAAALLAGVITFFLGPGLRALLLAPRYRPATEAGSHPLVPRTAGPRREPGSSTSPARIPSLGHPSGTHSDRSAIRMGPQPWGTPMNRSAIRMGPQPYGFAGANPKRNPALPEARDIVLTEEYGNWIRVPALSLNLPLAAASSMENTDILRALQVGVVRYPNGVEPGQLGVVAVAGHSTGEPWKGRYRFAFLHARKLRPGDVIHVDHRGTRYTYRVTGQRTIDPRTVPLLPSVASTPRLNIITCWPLWTTKQRLVVEAELQERVQLVVVSPKPLTAAAGPT